MNIWTQTRMGFHNNSDAFYDSMKQAVELVGGLVAG
jgi:hypothetical protein